MQKDLMPNAFFMLVLTIVLVLLYPLLHNRIPLLSSNFKSYSFFDSYLLKDSTLLDTTMCFDTPFEAELDVPKYNGSVFLNPFFKKLQNKNSQTRIAYYGDSVIEGDLLSQTVRDSLQKRFGGRGVGFVPITSKIPGFRRTIHHHFSGNWSSFNMLKSPPEGLIIGYLGETFFCKNTLSGTQDSLGNATILLDTMRIDSILLDTVKLEEKPLVHDVRYIASRRFAGISTLANAKLYYASTDSVTQVGTLKVKIAGKQNIHLLDGKKAVNETQLNSGYTGKINLEFADICSHLLYGISFESPTGVILDNIPSRGNSGAGLMRLRPDVMNEFQAYLGLDLVVLNFGLNVLNAKMTDYSWYATEMTRVVRNMEKGFPGVSILILGPADHAIKLEGKMQTDPSIERITSVLRAVAEKNETAFFSFYEAMGGRGSMIKWVEQSEPKLANSDYTHFNFKGAEKAGKLLLTYLMEAFEVWESEI